MPGITRWAAKQAEIDEVEHDALFDYLGGGNTPPILTINNGVITLPSNVYTGSATGVFLLATQGGASTDDLDQIVGGARTDVIELGLANANQHVRVRSGVANIHLYGGLEFTLNSVRDGLTLRNRTGAEWVSRGQHNL